MNRKGLRPNIQEGELKTQVLSNLAQLHIDRVIKLTPTILPSMKSRNPAKNLFQKHPSQVVHMHISTGLQSIVDVLKKTVVFDKNVQQYSPKWWLKKMVIFIP